MDQHEESEGDHVPPGGAVILHAVESPGHVTVAVITAEIVHPPGVKVGRLSHCSVVGSGASWKHHIERFSLQQQLRVTISSRRVECPILGGGSKSHVISGDIVRAGEVSDNSLRGCDTHVSNEGKEPCEAGNGSPYYGVGISL